MPRFSPQVPQKLARNRDKDPARITGGGGERVQYLSFMACPQGPLAFQYGASRAREVFFAGGGEEVVSAGRGMGKCLFLKGV